GDGGLWGLMTAAADTHRVRDSGYSRVVTRPPNSTLQATCFDAALALTSRLGAIFSDLPPLNIEAPDFNSFTGGASGVYNQFAGLGMRDDGSGNPTGNSMSTALSGTFGGISEDGTQMMGTLNGYLDGNFASTQLSQLTQNLGGNVTGALDGFTSNLN